MDIYSALDDLRPAIARRDWTDLEAAPLARCQEIDPEAASRIGAIDLNGFKSELASELLAVAERIDGQTNAVYWEFDPDNAWTSAFFPCRTYRPEHLRDDEWAADFDEARVVPGPAAPSLAREYDASWDRGELAVAGNVALIARTIATIGRAAETWRSSLPLCAGFHDQAILYRIRE
jgi:hypothetical protein